MLKLNLFICKTVNYSLQNLFKVSSINYDKCLLIISVAFESVLASPTVSTIGYDAV